MAILDLPFRHAWGNVHYLIELLMCETYISSNFDKLSALDNKSYDNLLILVAILAAILDLSILTCLRYC